MAEKKIIVKRIRIIKPIHLKDEQERLELKNKIAEILNIDAICIEMLFEDKSFKINNDD